MNEVMKKPAAVSRSHLSNARDVFVFVHEQESKDGERWRQNEDRDSLGVISIYNQEHSMLVTLR